MMLALFLNKWNRNILIVIIITVLLIILLSRK